MEEQEVFSMLEGAGDAAFAVDQNGLIRFWSRKAEELLGFRKEQVLQQSCAGVLEGKNEAGSMVCCSDCRVLDIARKTGEVAAYDLQARTASGQSKWLNVSILVVRIGRGRAPLVVHMMRDVEHRKRLEGLTRDIMVSVGRLTGQNADEIIRQGPPSSPSVNLTQREKDILRLLSLGKNPAAIAAELHLSNATVRNHIQHILGKMGCHSQLEAALRAVRENLI
jgi:PAS domain S-box-containing protein